ncbi:MAG: zinc ribbon domain-containing protein [Thermodesulfobacteriota bacterium]
MRDQIHALEQLQNIDIELKEIEVNLDKYPREISNINIELQNVTESISDKQNSLAELEHIKSKVESDLQYNLETIKKAEEKLFEIKTHKEYEAIQKEIAESKRNNSELEEQIFIKMEEIESLQNELKTEEDGFTTKETDYKEKISEYELLIEDLKSRQEPKITEKAKILERINSDVLPIYEQVIKKNGTALALVEKEICTGCNMNIPPQLYNLVLTQNKIYQCPNCKKILYTSDSE